MAKVEKISVALTPELAARMREAVAALGRLRDEGLGSGPSGDGPEAFTRIRRSLDAGIAGRHG